MGLVAALIHLTKSMTIEAARPAYPDRAIRGVAPWPAGGSSGPIGPAIRFAASGRWGTPPWLSRMAAVLPAL